MTIEEIRANKAEAEAKAGALRNEAQALAAEIQALKSAMVRDASLDPAQALASIESKERLMKIAELSLAHAETARFDAAIAELAFPISGWQTELETAYNVEIQAKDARKAAEDAAEEATRRVTTLEHLVKDRERQVVLLQNQRANHTAAARAAVK